MATTLPKCVTRLPTTCCTSPLVHNDDEDEDEDEDEEEEEEEEEEEVSNDTMDGKPEEQDHQHIHSSGLIIYSS